ncbi:MAG: hypothetical protein ACREQE_03065 [Candidatus Binataceae bacterium]
MKISGLVGILLFALIGNAYAGPGLRVLPRRINFGRVSLATNPSAITKQFTIVNRSRTNTINATVSSAFGAFQSQAVTLSLPPQQSVVIQVNFDPPAQAQYIGVIAIKPDSGRAVSVILRGTAKGVRPVSLASPTPTPTATLAPATPTLAATPTPIPTMAPPAPTPSPTSTSTPAATPSPATTASATPSTTPTPSAQINAAVMISVQDSPTGGNGQGYLLFTISDPSSSDRQTITTPAGESTNNACFIVPIDRPVGTQIEITTTYCQSNAIGDSFSPPQCALPINPNHPSNAVTPQDTFNLNSGGDTGLEFNALSVGLSTTPQSAPMDPNKNVVDPQGYGVFMTGPVNPNPFTGVSGPFTYMVSGCNGINCPTVAAYYNDQPYRDIFNPNDPGPGGDCIVTDPMQ